MKKKITSALAASALTALAGCGSNAPHHTTTSPKPVASSPPRAAFAPDPLDPQQSNPVAILKETGAKLSQGAPDGDWTLGDTGLQADGEFYGPPGSAGDGIPGDRADGEQVTVTTFATPGELSTWLATDKPDSGDAVIVGRGFVVDLTGMAGPKPFGGIYGPHPAKLAKRLHARLLPGSAS